MKAWWQGLSLREQFILMGGGIFAGLLFFYFLIWSPFTGYIQTLQQKNSSDTVLLHWMQSANQDLQQLRQTAPSGKPVAPADLLNTIDQNATQNKIRSSITQLSQADNDKVEVKLTSVNFDDLVNWLAKLWQQHRIEVDQITVAPKGNGIVQVDMVLKAS